MNTSKPERTKLKKDRSNVFKQKAKESKQKHLKKLSSNATIPIRYKSKKRKLDEELKNLCVNTSIPDRKSMKGNYVGLKMKRKIGINTNKKRKIDAKLSQDINNDLKHNG